MSPSDNKTIVERYLNETWNKRNLGVVDEVVAADMIQHVRNVTPGRDGVFRFFKMIFGAFPDARLTIHDLIAEGDRVVWRFTVEGTHQGLFMGIPATGRAIALNGINIARMQAGQVVESWNVTDDLGLLQQLGVLPRPNQPAAGPS